MEKKVIISIQGKQSLPQCEPEIIEQVAQGTLEDRGEEGVVLSYQETEATGLEGTRTTLQVEPGRVILRRTGAVNSQMVFEEGREHLSLYHTPYGALEVGLRTQKIHASLDRCGGELTIYYALALEHGTAGRNMLRIHVRPADREDLEA